MVAWGDSLTFGAGASAPLRGYPHDLGMLANRPVENKGVAGETSTEIRDRMVAATALHSRPTIIWAGRNNYTDGETVQADIAAMVSALGHEHYLVLSILNSDDGNGHIGDDGYNTIIALNEDLASTYGAHYIDIRAHLVSLYDPNDAQDVIDHANDVTPTSLRADGDTLHLNDAGYQAVADKVFESIGVLL